MKRSRTKTMGVTKKRRTKKPRSLMKRVDKKIAKAVGKISEFKLKSVTYAALAIFPLASAADTNLPVANITMLTQNWPSQGSEQGQRLGNSMKKCTTYFTIEVRLFLKTTAFGNFAHIGYRIIIFTSHENLDATVPITTFFQFNRNATTVTSMINPTNKARIIVLYDKVFNTGVNPNLTATIANGAIHTRKIIRYSRKFKEALFSFNSDVTPHKPTQNTYIAVFHDATETSTLAAGDCHFVTRYYWLD